ncbi:hypothetical protein [Clostridium tertium]|uniref:hypothetical protein n=1 Tax=Clostridium tertium TaxID=1559 RepID=UPI0024B344C4|nr:hypothetical protein [Clostridium tertium]MDI9217127.1 hypothetical protein [Clostridium tertium]
MSDLKYEFLPEVNSEKILENESSNFTEIIGDSPCPCCGCIAIPNKGDAKIAINYILLLFLNFNSAFLSYFNNFFHLSPLTFYSNELPSFS